MNFSRMIRATVLALSFCAFAAPVAQAADAKKPLDDLFPDPVLAKGKGFEIKQSTVQERFIAFRANAAARGQVVAEEDRLRAGEGILEQLIMVEIVKTKATEEDKKKAKELTDKIVTESKKQLPSAEAFTRQLQALNMTEKEYYDRLFERGLLEEYTVRQLKPSVSVPETAVKQFYETNSARFEQPEMVKLRHIMLATMDARTRQELSAAERQRKLELANKALVRAKAGEDFGKLAKEYSEDPGTKDRDGEMILARGMVKQPSFENAAFTLPPGKVSEIIITQVGYHIMLVVEKIPAKKMPFTEASQKIRDSLELVEMEKLRPALFDKMKKEAGLELIAQPKL